MSTATQLPIQLTDKLGNPFSVREYEAGDRAALEAMYLAFQPKRVAQGLPPETEYAIKRWLDHIMKQGGQHLLVIIKEQMLGHFMLIPMEDGTTVELAVFLDHSIRGRGIGTAMNRLGVSIARDSGFKRVWLSVELSNIPAIRSYQKAGFKMLPHTVWAAEIEMEVLT